MNKLEAKLKQLLTMKIEIQGEEDILYTIQKESRLIQLKVRGKAQMIGQLKKTLFKEIEMP